MAPSSPLSKAYSLLPVTLQTLRQRLLHHIPTRRWGLADQQAIRSRQNRTELPARAAIGQMSWPPEGLRCASTRQLLLEKKCPGSLDRKLRFSAYLRQLARIRRQTRLSSDAPFPRVIRSIVPIVLLYTIGQYDPLRDKDGHLRLPSRR